MAARSTVDRAPSINGNAKLQPSVDAMFPFYEDRRPTSVFARKNCK
jgi:hypothetical protein